MSSAYSYHIPIVILSLNKPNLSPYYIKAVTNIQIKIYKRNKMNIFFLLISINKNTTFI